jgi:hypothetical protein
VVPTLASAATTTSASSRLGNCQDTTCSWSQTEAGGDPFGGLGESGRSQLPTVVVAEQDSGGVSPRGLGNQAPRRGGLSGSHCAEGDRDTR